MSKWVCIQPTWWDGDTNIPGASGPKKGEIVEVIREMVIGDRPFLILRGYEIGEDGRKEAFAKEGFRPLLDGDLGHQVDEIEEGVLEEERVLA